MTDFFIVLVFSYFAFLLGCKVGEAEMKDRFAKDLISKYKCVEKNGK